MGSNKHKHKSRKRKHYRSSDSSEKEYEKDKHKHHKKHHKDRKEKRSKPILVDEYDSSSKSDTSVHLFRLKLLRVIFYPRIFDKIAVRKD